MGADADEPGNKSPANCAQSELVKNGSGPDMSFWRALIFLWLINLLILYVIHLRDIYLCSLEM